MSYYNTTSLEGPELEQAKEQALTQENRIVEVFQDQPERELTPFEVQELAEVRYRDRMPITSVRRAMTDLAEMGVLDKTGIRRIGPYRRPNYCWRLRRREEA